ncbi:hypothetical protein [Streptomyces zhihengii]
MPTIHDRDLSPGDDLGLDTAPTCCDDQTMTTTNTSDGYQQYTCSQCLTVVEITPSGLIFDIRQRRARP